MFVLFLSCQNFNKEKWNINVFIVSQITGFFFVISPVFSVMHGIAFNVNVPMNKCLVNNHFASHCFTPLQDIDCFKCNFVVVC